LKIKVCDAADGDSRTAADVHKNSSNSKKSAICNLKFIIIPLPLPPQKFFLICHSFGEGRLLIDLGSSATRNV